MEWYLVHMDTLTQCFSSTTKKDLVPLPVSIAPVEGDLDVKVYHVPIDDFNEQEVNDSLSVDTK
eukprot:gene12708-13920_t